MNERRMNSIELLKWLNILKKENVISSLDVSDAVKGYISGDDTKVRSIIYSPSIPMIYKDILMKIREVVGNGGKLI